jgi:hypothetical protein
MGRRLGGDGVRWRGVRSRPKRPSVVTSLLTSAAGWREQLDNAGNWLESIRDPLIGALVYPNEDIEDADGPEDDGDRAGQL